MFSERDWREIDAWAGADMILPDIQPHYEVWGNFTDEAYFGFDAEFIETAMSFDEAKKICDFERSNPNRYAYVRDMNQDGKIVY